MHPTDDLTTRGGVMVAWAALTAAVLRASGNLNYAESRVALAEANRAYREFDAIRSLSASDAALARAIDAVPGVIGGPDALVVRCDGRTERV